MCIRDRILLLVLPLFAVFTRYVQKRMLAAQLDNRRAVAAVSGQVPETLPVSYTHLDVYKRQAILGGSRSYSRQSN